MRASLSMAAPTGQASLHARTFPMLPCLGGCIQVSAGPWHLPRRLLPGGRLGGAMRAATATRRSMYILVPTMTPVSSSTAPISTRSAAPACARRPVSARPAAAEALSRRVAPAGVATAARSPSFLPAGGARAVRPGEQDQPGYGGIAGQRVT